MEISETRPKSLAYWLYFIIGSLSTSFIVLFSNTILFLLRHFIIHEKCNKLDSGIGSAFAIDT